jgi:hypothetical protein
LSSRIQKVEAFSKFSELPRSPCNEGVADSVYQRPAEPGGSTLLDLQRFMNAPQWQAGQAGRAFGPPGATTVLPRRFLEKAFDTTKPALPPRSRATKADGSTGEAAKAIAKLMHPHFVKEEECAQRPVSNLTSFGRSPILWSKKIQGACRKRQR